MRNLILALLLAAPAFAGPLGLGAPLIAIPGSTWTVAWEDLPKLQADDWNDQYNLVKFATDPHALVSWTGASAAINDVLLYQGTPLFDNLHGGSATIAVTPWSEVVLQLSAGLNTWSSGTGPNWDGMPHAIALCIAGCGGTPPTHAPEPGTLGLVGLALLGLVWRARR